MAEAPIMPFATDAFVADTTHLDDAETGAYMMLLVALWRSDTGTLPSDPKKLSRSARCPIADWPDRWEAIKGFFIVDGDTIRQGRVTRDRAIVRAKIEKARENGRKGGRPKSPETQEEKPTGYVPVKLDESKTEPRKKLSINHEPDPIEESPLAPLGGKPGKGTRLPDEFPDAHCRALAEAYWFRLGREDIDVGLEAVKFRAFHEARGTTSKKWASSWQTWYMNAPGFAKPPPQAPQRSALMTEILRHTHEPTH